MALNGHKATNCPWCDSGKVECSKCISGKVHVIENDEIIEKDCETCNGEGVVYCMSCNGGESYLPLLSASTV